MIIEESFTNKELLRKLSRAARELILRAEFAGLCLAGASVKILAREGEETMCTDGRKIFVGPTWIAKKSVRDLAFDLLHEWLHILGNHVQRVGSRDRHVWNIACDKHVVRMACEILSTSGDKWTAPDDGVQPEPWDEKLSVEKIYDELMRQRAERKKSPMPANSPDAPDTGTGDSGDGEPNPSDKNDKKGLASDFLYDEAESYSEADESDFFQSFSAEIVQAETMMQTSTGKTLQQKYGSKLAERIVAITNTRMPWDRIIVGDTLEMITSGDHLSWTPPNRRYYPVLPIPKYLSQQTRKLLIPLDVSASVDDKLLSRFRSNILPAAHRATEIIVVCFDQVIRNVVRVTNAADLTKNLRMMQGAHGFTDIRPVFELVDEEKPSCVTVFTDGFLYYPDKKYPKTLWAIPRGGGTPPWGKTYWMDISW